MLLRLSDIEFKSESEELSEVIKKCSTCTLLASVRQSANVAGSPNSITLQELSCDVKSEIKMDNASVYVFLVPAMNNGNAELKRIYSLWKDVYLARTTANMTAGKKPDVSFLLELVNVEMAENSSATKTFLFSTDAPVFLVSTEEGLMGIFEFQNTKFEICESDMSELEYIAQQEGENETEDEEEYGIADEEGAEETEKYTDNDDFMSSDSFLDI